MADLSPTIETLEHRWMRAWVNRDLKTLKAVTSKDFLLLIGSKPPAILDRPSFLEAAGKRYDCSGYSFGDVVVRDLGTIAMFAAPLELKATVDGKDVSGAMWVVDVWRRGRVRRGWKLFQRTISRGDTDRQLPAAIRSMQLWK